MINNSKNNDFPQPNTIKSHVILDTKYLFLSEERQDSDAWRKGQQMFFSSCFLGEQAGSCPLFYCLKRLIKGLSPSVVLAAITLAGAV